MTQTLGIKVNAISYGGNGVNRIGLNPLSGALMDTDPRQRELWALRRSDSQYVEHSAEYVGQHVEFDVAVGRHSVFGQLGLLFKDARTPKLPALIETPAHEDIFATEVIPVIEFDDIVITDDEAAWDPTFVSTSEWKRCMK